MDRIMLFSQRYIRAIEGEQLTVELPAKVRQKFWKWLEQYDHEVLVSPYGNLNTISTMLAEIETDLKRENGWDDIPDCPHDKCDNDRPALYWLVRDGIGHSVLDAVELAYKRMGNDTAFQQEINKVLDLHKCPWRLSDGEFFKLDRDFVGARLVSTAHDALVANQFTGAADEFAKSRQELSSGEVKDAILHAGKSFESVLKVLTGLNQDHASANKLIQEMLAQGFFDDIPEKIRSSFTEQVMKTLPSLRNKIGGHGQGADIVKIPEIYGELALQLAAAFHNFLIAKHLQRSGKSCLTDDAGPSSLNSEIPF